MTGHLQISFLCAVFNEADYIRFLLESIKKNLSSKYEMEFIFVDDFSQDSTYKIIEDFSADHPFIRIKLLRNLAKGKVAAFNRAFLASEGLFIGFIGGDDLLPPQSVASRLDSLKKVACGSSDRIAQFSKMITLSQNKYSNKKILPYHKDRGNKSGGTTIMSRSLAELAFPIPEFLPSEDRWTMLCCEYLADAYHFPRICYIYRLHSSNTVPRDFNFEAYRHHKLSRDAAFRAFLDKFYCFLDSYQIESLRDLERLSILSQASDIKGVLLFPVKLQTKLKFSIYTSRFIFYLFSLLARMGLYTL